jgi:hypothetical protein
MAESVKPPRGRLARFVLAGALGLVFLIASVGPDVWVGEVTGHKELGRAAGGILPYLLGVWLSPKISYRRRDALIFLTMGWSAIPSAVLLVKVMWRTADTPHRDWPLRADEVNAGRRTSYPESIAHEEIAHEEPAPEQPRASAPSWSRDVTNGSIP